MDNTTYPGSDTDVNENCDFHSMASNDLDFVDHWVNLTVEKEVLRGSKLREEKLRWYPQREEYEVANINLIRSPCDDMNSSYYSFRKSSPGRSKVKTGSCSPRSNSPFSRRNSNTGRRPCTPKTMFARSNTSSFHARYGQRCPLRIAELAVPTKRQCIDTWRNKCDVLPAFMVERLRQQIMDEKPIVQIEDALRCFKLKPKSTRCKRGPCTSKLNNDRMVEVRNLCAAFSNKIGQRLITPQNLRLTPELECISKIVADDITKITESRRKSDLYMDKQIKTETADKIAIWIANILEDTSGKILEEDLRVKKQFERKNVKEERLITLIEKLLHHEKPSDLEEEEGPVLDFIDNLVENVMTICEPELDNQYEISNASPDCAENNEFDTSTLYTNITYTTEGTMNKSNEIEPIDSGLIQEIDQPDVLEGTELNVNDHIRRELNKIVESVIPADQNDLEMNNLQSDDIKDDLENDTDTIEVHKAVQESPGNSELTSHTQQVLSDPDLALVEDVVLDSKDNSEEGKDLPENSELISQTQRVLSDPDLALVEDVVLDSKDISEEGKDSPGNSELISQTQRVLSDPDPDLALVEDVVLDSKDISEEGKDSPENSELNSQTQRVLSDPDLALVENVVLDSKDNSEEGKDDPNPYIENVKAENDNVSDMFELLVKESLDDKNKKVKFSAVEMDVRNTTGQLDSNSVLQPVGENGLERERVSWHSSTVFAPPNDHLLSDADESWPDDLTTPALKPSASVSRSITSLGKIMERDEKILKPDGEIDSELKKEDAQLTELEILSQNIAKTSEELENIKKLNQEKAQIAAQIKNESNADSTHETDKTEQPITTVKTSIENAINDTVESANMTLEAETKGLILDSSTHLLNNDLDSSTHLNNDLDSSTHLLNNDLDSNTHLLKNDLDLGTHLLNNDLDSNTNLLNDDTQEPNQALIKDKQLTDKDIRILESDTNIISEAIQQKMKSSYAIAEPKHDYKVHAQTAPSWLRRHDHGKGEPSEESFRCGKSKEKMNETEIKNWCKDLDRMFQNLELWHGWIDSTCRNIMDLKHKREMNKLFVPNARKKDAKDWITLKKNIDKDAILWIKLNQRAFERLKMYKKKTKYLHPAESEILLKNDDKFETVLETSREIDSICLWMHRTIVSTEYFMSCDCKNNKK